MNKFNNAGSNLVSRIIVGWCLAGGFSLLFYAQQEFILTSILLSGIISDLIYLWYKVHKQDLSFPASLLLTGYSVAGCYSIYRLYYTSIWITYGICATVSFSDVCQYFVGKYGGYTRVNHFSPRKTGEGYIGGGLLTLLATYFFYPPSQTISWIILGILGDLWISILKRWLGIKDISNFLSSHGGWIDRLDGIFMASIVWAYLIT